MKNLCIVVLFLIFSIVVKAEENCVDCETRNQIAANLSLTGTNTGSLSHLTNNVSREIASEKIDPDLVEEICLSMKAVDVEGILEIMAEEEMLLEFVYPQLRCAKNLPTLMHFAVDLPTKYSIAINNLVNYFDGVKVKNPSFDYGSILNIVNVYKRPDGTEDHTTLLDWIDRTAPTLSEGSKAKLASIRRILVKRGALTIAQLNAGH